MQRLALVMLLLALGCLRLGPEHPVVVTREAFSVYWAELEQRWPRFFEQQCVFPPMLPAEAAIFNMVSFIEVEASDRFPTCTYRSRSNEIRIGDDKWGSGCVAHELGHAACDYLQSSRCKDFEHPNYRSRC